MTQNLTSVEVARNHLSRADSTAITRAEWVQDRKDINLYWWTVWTDKLPDTAFRVIGVNKRGPELPRHPWAEGKYAQGATILLGDLSFVPVPTGVIAYAKSERGEVLATIGRIGDGLVQHCGPMVYLQKRCKTRDDTVDPSDDQMAALNSAMTILMEKGVKAAITSLIDSGLFANVWEDGQGCPAAPMYFPDGVWEWR